MNETLSDARAYCKKQGVGMLSPREKRIQLIDGLFRDIGDGSQWKEKPVDVDETHFIFADGSEIRASGEKYWIYEGRAYHGKKD